MSRDNEIHPPSSPSERDTWYGELHSVVAPEADSDSVDRLSTNPCLVEILAHTTHSDILNCRRLSSGMNEFIEKNRLSLPRLKAHIEIKCCLKHNSEERTAEAQYVKLAVTPDEQQKPKKCLRFLINNSAINMMVTNPAFVNKYFKLSGGQIPGRTFDYPITSMAEGISLLFSLFLPRIACREISLTSDHAILSDNCVSALAEQIKKARFRCDVFNSNTPFFPGLCRLYTQLECIDANLNVKIHEGDAAFPRLAGLNRYVTVRLYNCYEEQTEAMDRVVDLIKDWKSSGMRIKRLIVGGVLCRTFVAASRSILPESVNYANEGKVRITWRKEQDPKIQLRVTYCKMSKYLNIHDIECK